MFGITQTSIHKWRFVRIGGFNQLDIKTGTDIASLPELDQKLWLALSCPVKGIEFDTKTLQLIDSDSDGHIRPPEIIAAVNWICSVLKNPDTLLHKSDSLSLSNISENSDEGRKIILSARQILKNLNKEGADSISIEDTTDTAKIFASTKYNGDGIIPASAVDKPELKCLIEEIITLFGGEPDRCGEQGINQYKLDSFYEQLTQYDKWIAESESNKNNIFPLGEKTSDAAELFSALKPKINDYFMRCSIISYDPKSENNLGSDAVFYQQYNSKIIENNDAGLASLPIAVVGAEKNLPLDKGINPAWSVQILKFRTGIVTPLLGEKKSLNKDEWFAICAAFDLYFNWLSKKSGIVVEPLGIMRVREILVASNYKDELELLIAKDKELETEAEMISSVDKLVRFHRDLYALLNNFVTFTDFYNPKVNAIFQKGSLYIDGRRCDLCLSVDDAAKHSALANLSRIYLLYCDCIRRGGSEKMTIVAAVTDGDSDQFIVGRNGIFYDRSGNDWDAVVTKIIVHPISISQAFWSPYKRAARFISEQIQKMASAKEKDGENKINAEITQKSREIETIHDNKIKPKKEPFDIGKNVGIFAAIGLAVGAIGTAVASIVTGLVALKWWQMILAITGILLSVSLPSMIIAWFKLKARNLGPLLDANGWAVNSRAKINIPFGRSLTSLAKLPENSEVSVIDPFAEKKIKSKFFILIIIVTIVVIILYNKSNSFKTGVKIIINNIKVCGEKNKINCIDNN